MTAVDLWLLIVGFAGLGLMVVVAPWYAFRYEHECVPAGCECQSLALRSAP